MNNTVFNNQQRSGYKELFSYGPYFYKDILEMDTNYRFAGMTIDVAAESLEKLIDNQFIAYAGENIITRMEMWLGINVDTSKTLEDRRKRVALSWNGGEKLTGTLIKSLVKSYTGCDETPQVTMSNSLLIKTQIKEENTIYVSDLAEQIEAMKPAYVLVNMEFVYATKIKVRTLLRHYLYTYDKSGELPDIKMLGAVLSSNINIGENNQNYIYTHANANESDEAGIYPNVTTIGAVLDGGMIVDTTEKVSDISYVACGINTCGEEGL